MTAARALPAGLLLVLCLVSNVLVAANPVTFKDGKRT
jgi:hypothetical protein